MYRQQVGMRLEKLTQLCGKEDSFRPTEFRQLIVVVAVSSG